MDKNRINIGFITVINNFETFGSKFLFIFKFS